MVRPTTGRFPSFPTAPAVPQYGTIQEVWANMTANYPGWNDRCPVRDFFNTSEARNITADAGTDFRAVMVELYTRDSYCCGRPWSYCWRSAIVDGLNYLYSVPGKAKNGLGPGECDRVSCSYNGAIWWCNDNDKEFKVNSFEEITVAAYYIYFKCREEPAGAAAG